MLPVSLPVLTLSVSTGGQGLPWITRDHGVVALAGLFTFSLCYDVSDVMMSPALPRRLATHSVYINPTNLLHIYCIPHEPALSSYIYKNSHEPTNLLYTHYMYSPVS